MTGKRKSAGAVGRAGRSKALVRRKPAGRSKLRPIGDVMGICREQPDWRHRPPSVPPILPII